MAAPPRQARLQDVAREAGVHLSTVSRALNHAHDASMRPETRARIFEVAARLRYRPNALGRGLKLSRTGAIGFLVPSLRNPVNSPIVRHAFDRAWQRGFVVLLSDDSERQGAPEAYERLVAQGRIDGLLIQSARIGDPFFDHFNDGHIPCVFVDRAHQGSGRNVTMHDGEAGRLAARHLVELGHRALVHLAGPRGIDTIERRRAAFISEARAAGCDPVIIEAPLDEREGYRALEELGRIAPDATAVYIANINQAIGFTAATRDAGIRVPAELSILCHDDDPLAQYLAVPFTAIAMPLGELGATAVDTLVDQIDGKPPRDVVVDGDPELVDRGSTGPPLT